MARQLAVVLYNHRIGTLTQTDTGRHDFEYSDQPGRTPLSMAMPLTTKRHPHKTVEPFLDGLLTDNPLVRQQIGRAFNVSGNNPFALLEHIGMDCAGAVQFCPPAGVDAAMAEAGRVRPVSTQDVATRLRRLREDADTSWVTDFEEWSLAGAQPKIAPRETPDGWAEVSGGEPTTHILKPGIPRLAASALNEHICLQAATRLGLPAASTRFTMFDGEPAIVVQRYDRMTIDGRVLRIHQEDMCQALAVYPASKYESDGGPTASAIIRLPHDNAQPDDPLRFIDYLGVNYLLGAPDCHAKNFSLLEHDSTVELAPLYDVASVLPYDAQFPGRKPVFAFKIGGENRFGHVNMAHWAALAAAAGLDADQVTDRIRCVADRLPDAVRDAAAGVGGGGELGSRLLPQVQVLCDSAKSGWFKDVWGATPVGSHAGVPVRRKTTAASTSGSYAPRQHPKAPEIPL